VSPSKGAPVISFRVSPELRARIEAKAARMGDGTTLTAVIVAALEDYVEGEGDE